MDKNTLNAISLSCANALKHDDLKQYNVSTTTRIRILSHNHHHHQQLALKEYGTCIKQVGQLLSTSTFSSLCEDSKTIHSMVNIAQQCISRTHDILSDQEVLFGRSKNNESSQQQQSNNRLSLSRSLTQRSLNEMSVEELTKTIEMNDQENLNRKQKIDELMKLQRRSDYQLIKELSVKMEESKMQKIQMEQYLRVKMKKREEEEVILARQARRDRDRKFSSTELKRLSTTVSKHSAASTPDTDKWVQLTIAHFDYSKKKDHLLRDQQFLQKLLFAEDREGYIRKHITQITSSNYDHPFVPLLQAFAKEFNSRYNDEAAWLNLKSAIAMIKSFQITLTEIVTTQWTAIVPTTRKFLYYTDETTARKQLEEGGLIISYVLAIPLLNAILSYVYNNLMLVYHMQTQNKSVDDQLNRLRHLTLSDLDVPEPFSMHNEVAPYKLAISTLAKLNNFVTAEDLLAVIFKCHLDIAEEVKQYCNTYNLQFKGIEEQECPIILYVMLQSGASKLSCICNYIEDFVDVDEECTVTLNLFSTALQWSLEFNPNDWESYSNNQSSTLEVVASPNDDNMLSDMDLDEENYLDDLDMNTISADLEDKLSSLLSTSVALPPKPTVDQSDIDKLKKLIEEKEEQFRKLETSLTEKTTIIATLKDEKESQQQVLTTKVDQTIAQLQRVTSALQKCQQQAKEKDQIIQELQHDIEETTKQHLQQHVAMVDEAVQTSEQIPEEEEEEEENTVVEDESDIVENKVAPLKRCKAVYNFEAMSQSELNLNEGDVLVIVQDDSGDGWWSAYLEHDPEKRVGLVPENYLEVIE
jgi:hypothetical protein